MKEAAGEANMTVITIVLIGLVAAAGAILLPQLLGSTQSSADCSSKGGTWYNNACYVSSSCTMTGGKITSCKTKMK